MSPGGSIVSDWGSSGGMQQSWSSEPSGSNPWYGTASMGWTTTSPPASCPPNATPCPGECFLPDSCGGEYVWTPSSDLPPIATNIVTVDVNGDFVSSTVECNSNAFYASYPTDVASYVTQQLGPSCNLELIADGSTITQTAESGSVLYLGACGVAAENVPMTKGASCCNAAPTLSWDTPIWYTGSFYPTTVSQYNAYAAPSIWDAVPPLSTVSGCSILVPGETGITFPGPSTYTSTVTSSSPPPPSGRPPPPSGSETTTTTTTTQLIPSIKTTTIPLISTEVSITTDYIISTTIIPPIVQTTTLTRILSGSTTTLVSTLTQSGTTSVVTQRVTQTLPPIVETTTLIISLGGSTITLLSTITRSGTTSIETEETTATVPGPTSVVIEETTVTVSNEETISLIPISTGVTVYAGNPSPTISNVFTGPPCTRPAVENFFDVQWYYYAVPSSGIPPLATHQPYVFPNNETSTSIICNTHVFEKYLRTQLFDCRLGRGPYQTLDCDCNIIVGPIFTGNGPTPTGPGITVTQTGPSGTILDLGTSISGNYIPVTGAGGQSVCASTTTTILSTPLIYIGAVTIVPSFYRTVQHGKRTPVSATTSHVLLPGLESSSNIGSFTQSRANIGVTPSSTTVMPAGSTTTLSPKLWQSSATDLPVSVSASSTAIQMSSTPLPSTTTTPTGNTSSTTASSSQQSKPPPPSSSAVTSSGVTSSTSVAPATGNAPHILPTWWLITGMGLVWLVHGLRL